MMDSFNRARPGAWMACAGWIALCGVAALGGCGGGGGSAGAPPPPPPPPPAEAAYLVTGVTYAVDGGRLQVYDPANPAHPVATQALDSTAYQLSVPATSVDVAAGTVRVLGQSQVVYLSSGKLWRLDLRGGHSHAPEQLTAFNDVCSIDTWIWPVLPLSADGQDAWVRVWRGSPGDGCTTAVMVRTQGGVAAQAVDVTTTAGTFATPLEDAAGQLVGFLTQVDWGLPTSHLKYFNREGQAVDVPGTAPGAYQPQVVKDPAAPGHGWMMAADGVRQITWSPDGFTLGTLVYAPREHIWSISGSAAGLLVLDGPDAWQVDDVGLARRVATVPNPEDGVGHMQMFSATGMRGASFFVSGFDDPTYGDFATRVSWWTGDAMATGVVDTDGLVTAQVLGTQGHLALVLRVYPAVTMYGSAVDWDVHMGRLSADDGAMATFTQSAGYVVSATRRLGDVPDVVATWGCPARGTLDVQKLCAPGEVVERDFATEAQRVMGNLDRADDYDWGWQVPFVEGVPTIRSVCGDSGCDLVLVVPGQAASLRRLTTD